MLIYDACGLYREINADWPARLTDLADKYISRDVLICPECSSRGLFRLKNRELRNIAESDSLTVYKWELNLQERTDDNGDRSWRELKLRQRETEVGEAVPIVRCDQHSRNGSNIHYNLTFGGDIFVSGPSWEEEFRKMLPTPYLLSSKLVFADTRPLPERVSTRPKSATLCQIDLQGVANALPGDPWQDGISDASFENLLLKRENGLLTHRGIAFDIRALVQLDGRRKQDGASEIGRSELFYPTGPVQIEAKFKAHKLHVLAGVVFPAPEGIEVGGLRIKFRNGDVQMMPWIYGKDVRDGWHDSRVGQENEKLVWQAEPRAYTLKALPNRTGGLRVYHLLLDLQYSEVSSLEFYSSASNPDPTAQYPAGPFLLALTVE